MVAEASPNVAEDAALGAHFVVEEEVFDFICELHAIFEVQEYFDAAGDKVLYIFHFLPKNLNVSLSRAFGSYSELCNKVSFIFTSILWKVISGERHDNHALKHFELPVVCCDTMPLSTKSYGWFTVSFLLRTCLFTASMPERNPTTPQTVHFLQEVSL